MTDTSPILPEDIAHLEDEAEALEERAERDGVIPDEDAIPEKGIGPQTGLVP